jgi:hypothetical protein
VEKDKPSADLKFGYLPRVHKDTFTKDTNRYVLRRGFPDFPSCPFGGDFSMLGYDTKQNIYVWLSKSIIKSKDLNVIQHESSSMVN